MSQRVQAVVVALFVLVIAGVVVVLLMRVDREAPPAAAPTGDATGDLESASSDPVGRVVLNAGEDDLLVRFLAGSCTEPGGPKLDVSDDLGYRFRNIRLPQVDDGSGVGASTPTIRAIAFAEATSSSSITVAGADEKCRLHRFTTTDAGLTWEQTSDPIDEWYVDPASGGVVSPSGPADPGCKNGVAALAPVTKNTAKAACAGGTIRTTSDGGGLWTTAGVLEGVTAAAFSSTQTGYATVPEPGCESRVHVTIDGGFTWQPRGCVLTEFDIPAMGATDTHVVAGGTGPPKVSTNEGVTWKAPPKPSP